MIERRFEEDDLQSLLDLLRSSYDGWHDVHYWAWKYEKNPHGSPVIWVAEDRGRIVGCYILNPVRMRIGQFSVLGAQSVDAAVDNVYRGAGIFKKLATAAINQASKEGVEIIYAFPTEIAHKGQVRIGYRPLFIIPKMFKVFRMHPVLEEADSGNVLLQKALSAVKLFQKIGRKEIRTRAENGLEVRKIGDFDSRFEIFWNKVCKENKYVLVERDMAYLRWRYVEHPEKRYTSYVCEKNGEVAGFIVMSVERDISIERGKTGKLAIGNIIDLLTLHNMTHVAFPLVSAACNHFENESVDVARCWMFRSHSYHAILRRFGFSEHFELLRRVVFRPRYNAQLICYVNSRAHIEKAFRSIPKQNKPCWFTMQGDTDYM